jgi:hypothetical protein
MVEELLQHLVDIGLQVEVVQVSILMAQEVMVVLVGVVKELQQLDLAILIQQI